MIDPTTGLVVVRGAELIHNRMLWAPPGHRATLAWYQRVWRYMGPRPLRLPPREQFVLASRTHWVYLVKTITSMAVAFPVMILANLLLNVAEDTTGLDVWWLKLAGWLALVAHEIVMLHRILAWRAQLLVVTSHRIIRNRGVFGKVIEAIPIHNITAFTVDQSKPWQLALGYGTVRIESGGFHNEGAAREFTVLLCDPEDVWYAASQFPMPLLTMGCW